MDSDDEFMSGVSDMEMDGFDEQDSADGMSDFDDEIESPAFGFSQDKDLLRPKKQPYQVDFKVLSPAEIQQQQQDQIEETGGILGLDNETAAALLRHLAWNKEKLIEMYVEKPEELLDAVGLGDEKAWTAKIETLDDFMCEICCDEGPGIDTFAMKCGHRFCLSCYKHYLTSKITEDGEAARIQCPSDQCRRVIDSKTLALILDAPVKARYSELITRTYVDDKENLKWCPAPECVYAISCKVPKRELDRVVPSVACDCGNEFCFGCTLQEHLPAPCEQVKLWLKKCQDDSETANWISANTKECPKCGSTIEKNGGCNHMTCRKCRYEFCWICMGLWSDHGSSWFKCNRFDEKSGVDARDVQAKSRQSLERYLFYYTRYHNHAESAKLDQALFEKTEKKMTSLQTVSGMSWVQVQFLATASKTLQQCRQTLKWTYAFAFYLARNNLTSIFEDNQADLEMAVENLSEMFEKPIEELAGLRLDILDKTTYCSRRRVILLNDTAENLSKGEWQFQTKL